LSQKKRVLFVYPDHSIFGIQEIADSTSLDKKEKILESLDADMISNPKMVQIVHGLFHIPEMSVEIKCETQNFQFSGGQRDNNYLAKTQFF